MRQLYSREPALDKGARGTLLTFMSQGEGDVLVTWENDAWYALENYGAQQVQIVYPSVSIKAEPVVAVVDRNARQRETTEPAKAYLDFLFSEAGQKAAVKNFLRPRDESLPLWDPAVLSKTRLVSIEDRFGSWEKAYALHFSEGGSFDRIYQTGP